MGRARKKSLLGNITGKVGSFVFSDMRGTKVVKKMPVLPKKGEFTPDQADQRARFKCAEHFLRRLGYDVARIGYQLPKNTGMSEANAVMQHLMLEAVTGKYPDYRIDFSNVKLSNPVRETDACWNGSCVAGDGLTIEVSWEKNPYPEKTTRLDDNAAIVFFDETWGRNNFMAMHSRETVPRSALKWNYKGLPNLLGHKIHCWIFFVSADGKRVSQSEYLGMVTMKE